METIRRMAEIIKEKFNPREIILFGSYARGRPQRGSDIDLLVIMDTSLPVREQAFLIRREFRTRVPTDIIVRTPDQIKERIALGDFFIKRVVDTGIPL